jgi:hypothetical protein
MLLKEQQMLLPVLCIELPLSFYEYILGNSEVRFIGMQTLRDYVSDDCLLVLYW